MLFQRVISILLVSFLCAFGSKAVAQTGDVETLLRAVLAEDPTNDTARKRLSVLLLQTGRVDGALYHARYLSKWAAWPLLRKEAGAVVAQLDGPTWGWRPIFSVVPSSNLNKGASGDEILVGDSVFAIDEESRAQDGIALTFGAAVWKNWRPNETWRGTLSGELSSTVYPDSEIEETQRLATTLAFDRRVGRHDLAFGLTLDAQAERGRLERRRITPFVSGTYEVSSDRQLTARLDWSDVHYPQETYRSGPTTRLTLGWRETLSPRTRLHFSVQLTTERTGRDHLDNDSIALSAQLERLWGQGALKTSIGFAHGFDDYLGTFPGTTTDRRDRVSTISLEIANSKLDIKGFVPTLRYEYTRSHSNVSLYDFDSHDVQVTFQKKF